MSDEILVSPVGPYSWFGTPDAPSVYTLKQAGVYIWAVPLSKHVAAAAGLAEGFLPYYIGELATP